MNVQFSEALRQAKKCFELAEKANELLIKQVLVRSADSVEAKWGHEFDAKGRPLVTLTLSDWSGSATAKFSPEIMRDASFPLRLHQLWGDVLQIRSHRLLRELQETATAERLPAVSSL